jgi:16S rRNA processing protein RimM
LAELLVGIVRRPHGLSGELSVEIVTQFPEQLSTGRQVVWEKDGIRRFLTISSVRPHSGRLLVSFEGVDGIEAAETLAGGELAIDSADSARPDGFLFSDEIEGWECMDGRGRFVGRARDLQTTAAGPLLALIAVDGREILVPFVWPIVISVDREARRIVLDPPEGLLDL